MFFSQVVVSDSEARIVIFASIAIQTCDLFGIAATVCKKAVDLTYSAKNRRKPRIINLNFQTKKSWIWPVDWFEICLPNQLNTA